MSAVTLCGLVSTAAFNQTFGRRVFESESPYQWFVWGVRSLVPTALIVVVTLLALMVAYRMIRPRFRALQAIRGAVMDWAPKESEGMARKTVAGSSTA